MTKRYAQRGYAKLACGWYRDDVLSAVSDEHPHALAVWPILVAMAKEASGEHNPGGEIRTTWKRLGAACACNADEARAIVTMMCEGEMLTVEEGRLGTLRINLIRFAKWQSPRGSEAERQQHLRDAAKLASRENTTECHVIVTPSSRPSNGSVTQSSLEEKRIEEIRDSSASVEPKTDHTRILFDLWITETSRNANQNRLTNKRRGLVRARLKDGYTLDQLADAIRGIASSPWHQGQNPNGTRYDSFDFIMRSGENVEKGLERTTLPAGTQGENAALIAALGGAA